MAVVVIGFAFMHPPVEWGSGASLDMAATSATGMPSARGLLAEASPAWAFGSQVFVFFFHSFCLTFRIHLKGFTFCILRYNFNNTF